MFFDLVPRPVDHSAWPLPSWSLRPAAQTRAAEPFPTTDRSQRRTRQRSSALARGLQDRTAGHADDQGLQGRRSVRRLFGRPCRAYLVAAGRRGRGREPHDRPARRETDRSSLGQKYFEHPDVSVAIKQSTAHVVTVDGAVNQAGQYPVGGPMTLIQAVALARGTTEDANPRRVAVFRTIGGQRQAAAFDLTAIRRGEASDPQIYRGRYRCGRRIEDQGGPEADLPDRSATGDLQAF